MLSRELMRVIRRIELRTTRAVDSDLSGSYHSVFKGRGVVFSEVRKYQPGDDVSAIDWHVSARMNEPHIKVFTEERDHTVLLVLDTSASGLFGAGGRHKRAVAAEVAAILAFAAIKNNDRVGLIMLTDRVEYVLPPRKGRRHVLRVIHDILTYRPGARGTSLRAGLEYVARASRRQALVFLISDFLDDTWPRPLRAARKRHDVVPVVVTDPLEASLLDLGIVTMKDLETGQIYEFDTGGPEARRYAERVATMRAERQQTFRRLGLDAIDIVTNRPYGDALAQFFRARARRMKLR